MGRCPVHEMAIAGWRWGGLQRMRSWAGGRRAQLNAYSSHFTKRSMIVCEIADPLLTVLGAIKSAAVISVPSFLPALRLLLVIAVCKSAALLLVVLHEQ